MEALSDSAPRLSIVIAAWNGKGALEQCLRSLGCNGQRADTEVIVVTNFDDGAREMIGDQFPYVRHLSMPGCTTVPRLRARGIQNSRGEIVALAEDHCTFDQNWCLVVKKAHESHDVIGGAVENGCLRRPLDWAVYFYDYGKFMLPLASGPVESLSGINVSYKRAVLQDVETTFRDGFFEPFTHGELLRRGCRLYLTPALVVYNQKSHRIGQAVFQAYHLARSYAAKRVEHAGLATRIVFVVGSLSLPVLLTARILLRTLQKRRLVAELVRCFPYLLLLTTSWSYGELRGYSAGSGQSTGMWK